MSKAPSQAGSYSSYSYSAEDTYSGDSYDEESSSESEAEEVESDISYSEKNRREAEHEYSDTDSLDPDSRVYKMLHMFDKDMDDPLKHLSMKEKRVFLGGSKAEKLEQAKHPTIKYREAHVRGFIMDEERRIRLENRRMEEERYSRLEVMRERDERRRKQEAIRARDTARRGFELGERNSVEAAQSKHMELQLLFDHESGQKRDQEDKEYAMWLELEERRLFEADKEARRRAEAAAEEKFLTEEAKLTQWTVETMRQMGTIPGVDILEKKIPSEQRETATSVILRVRTPAPPDALLMADPLRLTPKELKKLEKKKKKLKALPFFDADLKRFRNVTVMKGERIGEKGGRELGRSLMQSVCSRMHTLDLSYCMVRVRGMSLIAEAFEKGYANEIVTLKLMANDLGAPAIEMLRKAFKAGWNQLKVLDLRKNVMYNEGACVMAHVILGNELPNLEKLLMQSNNIGDIGATAMCKACTAEKIELPQIQEVNLRFNKPSPKTLRLFQNCDWARFKFIQI
jgi:hypothetical protein